MFGQLNRVNKMIIIICIIINYPLYYKNTIN